MIRTLRRAVMLSTTIAATGLTLAAPAQASVTPGSRPAAEQDAAAPAPALALICTPGPAKYDIGLGDSGPAVSEVQCLLNHTVSWSAYPHSVGQTGYYNATTAGAVRVFQTCANNRGAGISVDGRVGRQTLPHLRWWGQHTYETGELMC